MSNAPKLLIPAFLLAAVAACNGQSHQNAADNMSAINNDEVGPAGNGAPADVTTLPQDESSATPSNQLVNGDDGPELGESNGDGNDSD